MRTWEFWYPYAFALLAGVFIWYLKWDLVNVENFELILNSTITISSIVIAFLGTMVSILISLTDAKVMRRIRENDAESLLTSYIKHSIVAGLALAVYSLWLYMYLESSGIKSVILLSAFSCLLTFFVLSSYRIFSLVSKILASVLIEKGKQETSNKEVFTPDLNND